MAGFVGHGGRGGLGEQLLFDPGAVVVGEFGAALDVGQAFADGVGEFDADGAEALEPGGGGQ
ncbi:hypothetical protein MFAL_20760 [Mycolicibacterium fallax]|nr:hypothetical protein MFAL_20760 [Mycolicibacterium fallax]